MVSIGSLGFISYRLYDLIVNHNPVTGESPSEVETLRLLGELFSVVILVPLSLALSRFFSEYIIDKSLLKPTEALLPNPQIPSIIAGNTSFLLNSGKLISLKEE